ncbi:MAG: folate-binding protein YgfZ [Hahellaceae bacterium]|nr:folate-binding protein YgfZ [Hahellaceae bacterium]
MTDHESFNASETIYTSLPEYCLIDLQGADAERFLQGQATCDLTGLPEDKALLGCTNTPKGRAYGVFLLARHAGGYLIRLPVSIAEDFKQRLDKYRVFFKTRLEMATDFQLLGAQGSAGIEQARALAGELPDQPWAITRNDKVIAIRLPGELPRFELWVHALPPVPVSESQVNTWKWHETSAGIAQLCPETVEEFVPQMLNLQSLGAISFKKGCYTGQEIVARMRYLGKLKKRLYLLEAKGDQTLPVNSALVDGEGHKWGQVVQCVAHEGTLRLLAVVDNETMQQGTGLFPEGQINRPLTVLPLPYEVQ